MAASLPRYTQFASLPPERRIAALDEFIQDVVEFLRVAPRLDVREVDMEGGSEASVAVSFVPRGVLVIDAKELSDPSEGVECRAPDWLYQAGESGEGEVLLRSVNGLTSGTVYRLRVLLVR